MEKDKYNILQTLSRDFLSARPSMQANNTPLRVINLLADEVVEAKEAIDTLDFYQTNATDHDPQTLSRLRKEAARELADIGIFLTTAFQALGLDMFEEMQEKIAFNNLRYRADFFTEDRPYEVSRQMGKDEERRIYQDFYRE